MAFVDEWLALPVVRAVGPGESHCAVLRSLIRASGTAGNLTSDAHLAALALEQGASICSTDAISSGSPESSESTRSEAGKARQPLRRFLRRPRDAPVYHPSP